MNFLPAIAFVITGMACASFDLFYKKVSVGQIISLLGFFPALLIVTSYYNGVTWFYGLGSQPRIAPYLSICFILLSLGGFFARPHTYLCQIFAGDDIRSIIARRLIPLCFLLSLIMGWLRLRGEQAGFFGPEAATAVFSGGRVALCVAELAWYLVFVSRVWLARHEELAAFEV